MFDLKISDASWQTCALGSKMEVSAAVESEDTRNFLIAGVPYRWPLWRFPPNTEAQITLHQPDDPQGDDEILRHPPPRVCLQ